MLLAIDVGNTHIKFGVFEKHILLYKISCESVTCVAAIGELKAQFPTIKNAILASVGKLDNAVLFFLKNNFLLHEVANFSAFPFKNEYATPNTLGIDRKVLTSGAALKYPNRNCLIIDAGTCITYDFLDKEGIYHGGAISPGIALRYRSLNNFTANLPLLTKIVPENIIGNSTENAIHSGVIFGVTMEINSVIERYSNDFKDLTIILTGGDTDFLAKSVKNTIFANSNFLLESLSELFTYKIKND